MLSNLLSSVFPQKQIIGIDIGSSSVKIACFLEEKKKLFLKEWGHIPFNFKPDTPPDERKALISREIKNFLKKRQIQFRYAATAVSGNSVIVRYVKLPKLAKKQLDLTIAVEAEPFIPFDIKDVNLTYHILSDIMEEGQPKMETVLVAAKKELVKDKLEILSEAGLEPVLIDVDSFALENIYSYVHPEAESSAVLFLNIGHRVTNLSIVFQGVTKVVRDIFIAGVTFDKAINKILKSDLAQAEALKKSKAVLLTTEEKEAAIEQYDREGIGVSKAITGVLKDLHNEVSRSIDFYLSQGVEHSISKIILTGGMANLGNITKFLSNEFKVPVEILNPFSFLNGAEKNIPKDVLPSLAVAAGLAIRKMRDWE
ncbi:MAG: type IV pilus assembly protein PilM [Elusimicrobia bacterium]|nr:type IV pilus assembly protein PilM [Elusimicrobiota bacterium]